MGYPENTDLTFAPSFLSPLEIVGRNIVNMTKEPSVCVVNLVLIDVCGCVVPVVTRLTRLFCVLDGCSCSPEGYSQRWYPGFLVLCSLVYDYVPNAVSPGLERIECLSECQVFGVLILEVTHVW
jgi:hypothetical protein